MGFVVDLITGPLLKVYFKTVGVVSMVDVVFIEGAYWGLFGVVMGVSNMVVWMSSISRIILYIMSFILFMSVMAIL